MEVTLLYFDGCPSWQLADKRLLEALALTGHPDQPVTRRQVTTPEQAEQLGFRGSPTVLVDGRDPFAEPGAPTGLACRMFRTPDGLAGAPTVEQLVAVLSEG
ncbi:MAG: thioredoxin family protein [Actinobacteria bacterium]|nr:thioredoxin family protein [Actinomycetota bacterium]